MVPIEQKDWTEEDRASKLGQNHPLDSTKRQYFYDRPKSLHVVDIAVVTLHGIIASPDIRLRLMPSHN